MGSLQVQLSEGEIVLDSGGPSPNDRCLSNRRGHLKVQAGKRPHEDRQKLERFSHKPRNAEDRQQPLEARAFRSTALLTPTSSLQKGEKMNLCCLKLLFAMLCYGSQRKVTEHFLPCTARALAGATSGLAGAIISPSLLPSAWHSCWMEPANPVWSHHACRRTPSLRQGHHTQGGHLASSFPITPPHLAASALAKRASLLSISERLFPLSRALHHHLLPPILAQMLPFSHGLHNPT